VVVELIRRADLLDPPRIDHHNPVGYVKRLFLVMGDEDRRHVYLVVQPSQSGPELLADIRIQGAEWLIEQQHSGLDGECAGQGHALPLATRQLGGQSISTRSLENIEIDLGGDFVSEYETAVVAFAFAMTPDPALRSCLHARFVSRQRGETFVLVAENGSWGR